MAVAPHRHGRGGGFRGASPPDARRVPRPGAGAATGDGARRAPRPGGRGRRRASRSKAGRDDEATRRRRRRGREAALTGALGAVKALAPERRATERRNFMVTVGVGWGVLMNSSKKNYACPGGSASSITRRKRPLTLSGRKCNVQVEDRSQSGKIRSVAQITKSTRLCEERCRLDT